MNTSFTNEHRVHNKSASEIGTRLGVELLFLLAPTPGMLRGADKHMLARPSQECRRAETRCLYVHVDWKT
jgi:hypothetical protein